MLILRILFVYSQFLLYFCAAKLVLFIDITILMNGKNVLL